MYRALSRILPKKLRKSYFDLLDYYEIKINPEKFLGFIFGFGFVVSIAVAIDLTIVFHLAKYYAVIIFLITFLVIEFLAYYILLMNADRKAKKIELMLPDALQLMASNLRAGMTVDKAVILSARPEFELLGRELNKVGKEIATGKSLGQALIEMSEGIRSEKLEKSVKLIVSGLSAGGELATLLEQTSTNLREKETLDKKIRSNVLMYIIFIFFAVGIGAPILFGLSSLVVKIISIQLSSIEIPEQVARQSFIPITITGVSITEGFIVMFALIMIVFTAILGSLALGLIAKGEEKDGIKYIPILVGIAAGLFFIVRITISNILSSFLGVG